MSQFRRPGVRWRRALFLSLGVHLAILLAGWFWPRHEYAPLPTAEGSRAGIRLEPRRAKFTTQASGEDGSGEDASDNAVFEASISSGLLIEPKLASAQAPRAADARHLSSVAAALAGSGDGMGDGRGGGAGNKGAAARFFQVESEAKRVVYVVDASSSMGKDGLWSRARREVIRSVDALPSAVVFQVIVYHSRARALIPARPGWLTTDAATRQQVSRALAGLSPEGRTMHGPALNLALAMRPDVVFFLTDADDLTLELLDQVERWNHGKAVIHTFELNGVAGGPGTPMRVLARRHGGEHRRVAP